MPASLFKLQSDLLQAALEQSSNAILITNADRSGAGPLIVYCNEALCTMTGYSEVELLGKSPRMLQGPATDRKVLNHLRDCLDQGVYFEGAAVNYRKNGETYYLEWSIWPVRDAEGVIRYYVSLQRDMTTKVLAQQERNLLAQALNSTNDAVWITDENLVIVFANEAMEHVSGYSRDELLGNTPLILRSGLHDPAFYAEFHDCLNHGKDFRATFINRHKSGCLYYVEQSIASLRDASGRISHHVGVAKDITAQVEREALLREQAHRDQLTGLLNRHAGEAELQRCKLQALTSGLSFGLVLGDIDHFKRVNDHWGHSMGDRVLQTVARVLQDTVRSGDHVVRWGGEEFLIILPDVSLAMAQELAERIRAAVHARLMPDVGQCSISMGVGGWQLGESDAALLQRVDAALYASKERGRNQVTAAQGGALLPVPENLQTVLNLEPGMLGAMVQQ